MSRKYSYPYPRPQMNTEDRAYDLSGRANHRRLLNYFLRQPCQHHDAAKGEPCWTIPGSASATIFPALCGSRIAAGLGHRGARASASSQTRALGGGDQR